MLSNSNNNKKIIVICGPTAVGKSDIAVRLAKKFDGEVISADSRQVYKVMDIGTGKITREEMHDIKHHMLDIISPKRSFNVARYQKMASKCIDEILERKKVPIICGGTGFYIDSLIYNTSMPNIPANKKLRDRLNKKTNEELFAEIESKDFVRAQTIDKNNKVRLIRALEIIYAIGKVPKIKKSPKYDLIYIGVDMSDQDLKKRIHQRLIKRLKSGMIEEVKKLHKNGVSWKRMEEFGLEYRYCARYIQRLINEQEFLTKLETEIWHYAKRQRTWFRRNKDITWFDTKSYKEILRLITKDLK